MQAFAREDAGEFVAQTLVLAEQESDLAATDADIARRHVGVRPDVAVQLGHETLTEPHHFVVALALRIEFGSALGAAHRQCRQRVLQHLLERQELEDAEVHRRVKPQAALVGADRTVHLDAEAAIDLDAALIVLPGHPEHQHALGLDHPFEDAGAAIFGAPLQHEIERLHDFLHRLMKLGFRGIFRLDLGHEVANKR